MSEFLKKTLKIGAVVGVGVLLHCFFPNVPITSLLSESIEEYDYLFDRF